MKQSKSVILLSIFLLLFGGNKNINAEVENINRVKVKNGLITVDCNDGDQLASVISNITGIGFTPVPGVRKVTPNLDPRNVIGGGLTGGGFTGGGFTGGGLAGGGLTGGGFTGGGFTGGGFTGGGLAGGGLTGGGLTDVVEVVVGVVKEPVSQNKIKIVVRGDCREEESVIISQNNIVINGLGGTITGNGKNAVFIIKGNNVVIKNFGNIQNGVHGIVVQPGGSLQLSNSSISNNKGAGLLVERFVRGDKDVSLSKILLDSIDSSVPVIILKNETKKIKLRAVTQAIRTVPLPKIEYSASLCDVQIYSNDYGAIFGYGLSTVADKTGFVKQEIDMGRCSLTISNHTIGGLGAFSEAHFAVENAGLIIENNNFMGAFAVGGSSLYFKDSPLTVKSSLCTVDILSDRLLCPSKVTITGHDTQLCREFFQPDRLHGGPGFVTDFTTAIGDIPDTPYMSCHLQSLTQEEMNDKRK